MKKFISIVLAVIMLGSMAYAQAFDIIVDIDVSAATAADISGNSYNVVTSATSPEKGSEVIAGNTINYVVFNSSLNDVISNYRLDKNVTSGLDNFTVEAFTKPYTDSNGRMLFSMSTKRANSTYYAEFADKSLNVCVNGTIKTADITDYLEKWGHWVFVRTFSEGKCNISVYVNSECIMNEEFDSVRASSEPYIFIGSSGNLEKDCTYRGYLSEIRFYNSSFDTERTKTEFESKGGKYGLTGENPDPDPDPEPDEKDERILFKLDVDKYDGTAESLFDSQENITAVSAVGVLPSKLNEKSISGITPSIRFDKTNNQAIKFSAETLKNRSCIVAETWLRYKNYMDKWQHPFALQNKSSGFSPETFSDNGNPVISFGTRTSTEDWSGKWTHFVYERLYNAEEKTITYKVFVNGKLKSDYTANDKTLSEDAYSYFYIGNEGTQDANNQFNGDVGKFVLYSTSLTEEEIGQIYETEKPNYDKRMFYEESEKKCDINKLSFTFNKEDETDFSLINDTDISVLDAANGINIPFVFSDVTDNTFTLNLKKYLKYGSSLKVLSSSVNSFCYLDAYKGVISADVVFYDKDKNKLDTVLGNTFYVGAEIKNAGGKKNIKCVFTAKNSLGQTVGALDKKFEISSDENIELKLENLEDVKELRFYIWELEENSMIPVYSSPIILK